MTDAPSPEQRSASAFILLTSFLNFAGVGLIIPVLPFIIGRYVQSDDKAFVGSLLFTAFSLFQFLSAPALGALSDRYGRRPVLLISLLGTALGYLLIGVGGALWVLFLGRIIDGITGGNISTIYAYAADITKPEERTRFFGLLGAMTGLGFVIGPVIGGVVYAVTQVYEAPLYLAALVFLINTAYGYFVMKESLTEERKSKSISLNTLNPFAQLLDVTRIPGILLLLVVTFFWAMSFAHLQSNFGFLTEGLLGWGPDGSSFILFLVGLVGIITQGGLVRLLVPRLGEARMVILGLVCMAASFILVALVPTTRSGALMIGSTIPLAFGNGLVNTSLTGLLSKTVSMREQGRIQGGNQSVQALARVVGPVTGGWAYDNISYPSPYIAGSLILFACAGVLVNSAVGRSGEKPNVAEI